jgi:hypothetical protein
MTPCGEFFTNLMKQKKHRKALALASEMRDK